MRIREDSPFFGISEEQKDMLVDEARELTLDRMAELWQERTGRTTTRGQIKWFLQRIRHERALRDAEDATDDLKALAERAKDGVVRDGLIEAARQKLFEEALMKGDSKLLLELYKAANDERAREREVAVDQRKAAVAEQNAMIGWSKLPGGISMMKRLEARVVSSHALPEGADVEQRLLPALKEALLDTTKKPEERLEAALSWLQREEAGLGERRLLGDGSAVTVSVAEDEAAKKRAEKEKWDKAASEIDWMGPAQRGFARIMKEVEEEKKRREGGSSV